MSLARDVLRRRLHDLRPPIETDGLDDDEAEELRDNFSQSGMDLGFSQSRQRRSMTSGHAGDPDAEIKASDCFETVLEVQLPDCPGSSFRVYYTPPKPASDRDNDDARPVCFVCHHGAGYSGLSFALFAKAIREASGGKAGVLALDCRGHGKTQHPNEYDMSLDNLANDLASIMAEVFPGDPQSTSFILVGHSMGGAIVVAVCERIQKQIGPVIGVANLDIVEGTAVDALSSMRSIISARPTGFPTADQAISWHVQSRTVQNEISARISVPPLFTASPSGESVLWRTDLLKTEPYWHVLAGADSLDKPLMIGQMQGKFQLSVFTDVGHCLQEDAPERLAALIYEFYQRNDSTDILKKVRKIGRP